jgi:hypothetical protein
MQPNQSDAPQHVPALHLALQSMYIGAAYKPLLNEALHLVQRRMVHLLVVTVEKKVSPQQSVQPTHAIDGGGWKKEDQH